MFSGRDFLCQIVFVKFGTLDLDKTVFLVSYKSVWAARAIAYVNVSLIAFVHLDVIA